MFSDVREDGDVGTGWIYVLRSNSDHPTIKEHRNVIHKIGVTGGDINKRLVNAKLDPTSLIADVQIVATHEHANLSRARLGNLILAFFEPARLDLTFTDRFGNPVVRRQWFLLPLYVIDHVIGKIRS